MSSELKDRAELELAFCKRPLAADNGNGTGRARRREISRVSGIAGFAREKERKRVWVGESLYDQNNSGQPERVLFFFFFGGELANIFSQFLFYICKYHRQGNFVFQLKLQRKFYFRVNN